MNENIFFEKVNQMNLPNAIFIDCTANDNWSSYYEHFLNASFSIVTANKIVNSGNIKYYNKLRNIAKKNNVKFLYETNVCSAMPVIRTLQYMIKGGDKILKIEGVLSGTLSYIFNSLKDDKKFSEIVIDAKEKGYTEPDPRVDLNGLDVARKLLILARETGAKIELKDVKVQSLISKELGRTGSLSQFMSKLKNLDDHFESLKLAASKKGKVLCYIAKFENGNAEVSIKSIGKDHPFYSLTGSDNIVSLTTKNNSLSPLTLSGRGAGARYTATGVLSDIITISNHLS
jgi:aspartokinase/homoserine dehydrogenase 1